ncbi:MAG: NAD(P)/FAD-dependent oxidoreductase [Candidatus Nitrosopolaris sp.]
MERPQTSDMSKENAEMVNPTSSPTRIVILGSGFAAIEVLKKLQNEFNTNNDIEITLVSRDNFILFTPMLPEVASGMIETRNIVTPVRAFCKKAKFYQAKVKSIDLNSMSLTLTHAIGRQSQPNGWQERILKYDYLVIALGSENNFFKMYDVQKYSFTMKSIDDAIILRNHIINVLEQASLEEDNVELRKSLLTFVVAGGGFNGVETVGAINDFIRDSIKDYYKNIQSEVRVILIDTNEKLLAEVDEELGEFALEKLKAKGVEFMMKCPVTGATTNSVKLYDGTIIPCYTLIWSAGVTPSELVADLPCEHDKGHRIITNSYLEVPGYNGVYALGDCASITDPHTLKPYPPTAQHAIREGKVAAENIILAVKRKGEKNKVKFDYKTKGMMAEIGKRTGVAILFNKFKLHGFLAWWLWRTYYLANLPTTKKKIKVLGDWISDLIFKPDVSMITREERGSGEEQV